MRRTVQIFTTQKIMLFWGVESLNVEDITFNANPMKKIQSRATSYTFRVEQIYGVATYSQGRHRLIDGQHRLKGALEVGKESHLNFVALVHTASNF